TQVACSKKFVVGKFLNFKINDAKPVMKQVEELQIIIHEMEVEGMEKALPNQIPTTKTKAKNSGGSRQKYSKDAKKDYTQQNNNNFKKVYHCWVCRKPGHKAKDCHHKNAHGCGNSGGNFNQANHVKSPKEFVGIIKSFLTTNVVDWFFDICVIKHKCNSRKMFISYLNVNDLEPMFMGNGTASKIEGERESHTKADF
ncbi:pol polyprotein, partial [Tanacetum coccineum]